MSGIWTLIILCAIGVVLSLLAVKLHNWLAGISPEVHNPTVDEEARGYDEFIRAVHTHGHDSEEAKTVMVKYEHISGFKRNAIVMAGLQWKYKTDAEYGKPRTDFSGVRPVSDEEVTALEEFVSELTQHGFESHWVQEVIRKHELRFPGFRRKAIVAAGIAWMGNAGLAAPSEEKR